MPEYLTSAEVAERYRTSESTLRRWRNTGQGPRYFRPGRTILYDAADLDAWDASLREPVEATPA